MPELSPSFDARLMRRVRPPRLTTTGRVVIALYALFAVAIAVWLMRDLGVVSIATALAIGVPAAAAASAYGRRLTVDH
jgi:hypothetical protein